MKKLFEVISTLNPNQENVVMTILERSAAGEKAVYSAGKLVWKSKESGFFAEHPELTIEHVKSGQMELDGQKIFCDIAGQEKHLVICGGGHVSIPVIQMGVMMGWNVTVLEDRPQFADNARRAGAQEVLCQPFAESLEEIEGSSNTYFVILTRGHRYDKECLEKIIEKKHAYIGMIGSRRRSAMVKESLIEKGCDKEVLDHVASPIGLNIGSETPEEIGVAIMAEIIAVKNREKRVNDYPKDIIQAVLDEENESMQKVLATIIDRQGSAPRGIGAKMLILRDGSIIGTIGGGCVEAKIQQKALLMMQTESTESQTYHADMTADEAEEEGMVCGGCIEVLLEKI